MTVRVQRTSQGLAVIIPPSAAKRFRLSPGDSVDLMIRDGALVLTRFETRPRRKLSDIVRQIDPSSYRRRRKGFPA